MSIIIYNHKPAINLSIIIHFIIVIETIILIILNFLFQSYLSISIFLYRFIFLVELISIWVVFFGQLIV